VVDDHHLPVGVLRGHEQENGVVQDLPDLGRVLGREPVHDERNRLAVPHLGRMNGGVEEVERPPLFDQGSGLVLGKAAGIREPSVDLDQTVEPGEVLGARDLKKDVVVSEGGLSDLLIQDAIGGRRDLLQILEHRGIAGHLPVGPELEAEEARRRSDVLRGR
jgi:hypothetical protein